MAKELGLNPRKLAGKIPSKSQPWKAPVHVWIRDFYERMQEKSARRRAAKQAAGALDDGTASPSGAAPPDRSRPAGSPPPNIESKPKASDGLVADVPF